MGSIDNGWTREWEERRQGRIAAGGPSEEYLDPKDAEIAALKQEVERLQEASEQFNAGWKSCIEDLRKSAEICRELEAELTTLRAKLEAMGRPVTDEEWVFHGGVNFSAGHKRALSAILASRASQPNPSEQL